jgi:hypothetical protein
MGGKIFFQMKLLLKQVIGQKNVIYEHERS